MSGCCFYPDNFEPRKSWCDKFLNFFKKESKPMTMEKIERMATYEELEKVKQQLYFLENPKKFYIGERVTVIGYNYTDHIDHLIVDYSKEKYNNCYLLFNGEYSEWYSQITIKKIKPKTETNDKRRKASKEKTTTLRGQKTKKLSKRV